MEKGYLSIVLHAHLPYVHHPESEDYIEERWLFEAITETYLPLLKVFEELVFDNINFRVTMSLTPTLLSMLDSPLLQERYTKYLDNLIALAKKETLRTKFDHPVQKLALMYLKKFTTLKNIYVDFYRKNIITGFKVLQDKGCLELITCAATHAFLPYVKTEQAVRAQIKNAVQTHQKYLGVMPRGIWLPECGYQAGLDRILKDYGIQYFLTDSHGLLHASPKPKNSVYAPIITPEGVASFARDQETSKQVWSSVDGYPGEYNYREYYRDIGFDLDYEYIKPHLHQSGTRLNTSIKYYCISDNTKAKEWYDPRLANEKAAEHAYDFMQKREKQAALLCEEMERKPLIVAAYDAELFGHWWYEGPLWLNSLCRKIDKDQHTISMITPTQYLREYPENQQCELSFSSWGRGGYGEVWLGERNEWIYRQLHSMEKRMIAAADRSSHSTNLHCRVLNQMARELMLAQSSDWAFIMDNQTMVDYALKRSHLHINHFNELEGMLKQDLVQEERLIDIEKRNPIFPEMDYHLFNSGNLRKAGTNQTDIDKRVKVLMLSWEFPPMIVGGLSKHVFDLSIELAKQDVDVHVITSHVEGYPAYEVNQNVHVHRVSTYQTNDLNFMDWVFQLNLAMMDYAQHLIKDYGPFNLIHAHDWLVCQAAKAIKQQYQLPLIATIHATEHGRNQGIHTDLQQDIHQLEWELTYEAERVICCSQYMEREIKTLFHLPSEKLDTIPNGVDTAQVCVDEPGAEFRAKYGLANEKIIFYVGRMVMEKGVFTLLESIPVILGQVPGTKFVLAGKGPMLEDFKHKARTLGIEHKVLFTGFIDDEEKKCLLHIASLAVFPSLYEPFGIVALEAMAAGTPVIVSGVGGLQEVIEHEWDGYTVLPGNTESLSSHVIRMLNDEKSAREMAEKARNKARSIYNWERIAKDTLRAYLKIKSLQETGGNPNESSYNGRGQGDTVASAN